MLVPPCLQFLALPCTKLSSSSGDQCIRHVTATQALKKKKLQNRWSLIPSLFHLGQKIPRNSCIVKTAFPKPSVIGTHLISPVLEQDIYSMAGAVIASSADPTWGFYWYTLMFSSGQNDWCHLYWKETAEHQDLLIGDWKLCLYVYISYWTL